MNKKIKTPSESASVLTNLVLPGETNMLNNLFGGELLARMDRISSIAAKRHSESFQVVTASVNHVSFNTPVPLGSIVKLEAKVTRAFSSSMEIFVDVWIDDPVEQKLIKSNNGIYTFVAVDENNKPTLVPQIQPETEEEKERYDAALRRKQLSLILAGKLNPQEAHELKSLFMEKK
ncbi:MAG: acyl-CoA thioesterase [Weeksellaceae bacterium]|jgi:acyl-CoA hydrolase|nr:acyl-CoA thioesterase [Weeksellaceae bacterium]MDX9704877.1 acyl-CoA thioesterase [Weeksellaceae bacterium]